MTGVQDRQPLVSLNWINHTFGRNHKMKVIFWKKGLGMRSTDYCVNLMLSSFLQFCNLCLLHQRSFRPWCRVTVGFLCSHNLMQLAEVFQRSDIVLFFRLLEFQNKGMHFLMFLYKYIYTCILI